MARYGERPPMCAATAACGETAGNQTLPAPGHTRCLCAATATATAGCYSIGRDTFYSGAVARLTHAAVASSSISGSTWAATLRW